MKRPRFKIPAGSRRGFTLLEMMVASILLGMLITILTMVFTASAAAWRNGKAGAWGLRTARRDLASYQRAASDALPRLKGNGGEIGYVSSVWVDGNSLISSAGESLQRGFATQPPMGMGREGVSSDRPGVVNIPVQLDNSEKTKTYLVGVGSAGPDGEWNTDDDIVSWPEDK